MPIRPVHYSKLTYSFQANAVLERLEVCLCHLMHQRQININMALMIVTSVPNRFPMMGPFLISVGDQWYSYDRKVIVSDAQWASR